MSDSSAAIRVAVVGMGIRGRMYATVTAGLHDAELVGVCDLDDVTRAQAAE
ncbi:hypothetical protein LCGC14_2913120, partial [marine sediment metagenome]